MWAERTKGLMAYDKVKTEHAGAKNGGGGDGHRADVKLASRRRRRRADGREAGVAPMVEQRFRKPTAGGSTPPPSATPGSCACGHAPEEHPWGGACEGTLEYDGKDETCRCAAYEKDEG